MAKARSRAIPYRVYKKMFADCPAHDYSDGKITVEFPQDYLESKMYTPEGWYTGGSYVSRLIGRAPSGKEVGVQIIQRADGGCKYYDAVVTIGNVFCGGSQRTKSYVRSFQAAVDWAVETAKGFVAVKA